MRFLYLMMCFLCLIQIVVCPFGVESSEITVKLKTLKSPDSKNPRYEVTFYRNDKQIAKRVYENGKTLVSEGKVPDGIVIERYDNGNVKNIIMFKNQKRNGVALGFYEDGSLKVAANYINDKPTGIGKMYYKDGNLMAEWEIAGDKEIYHVEHDEKGNITYQRGTRGTGKKGKP